MSIEDVPFLGYQLVPWAVLVIFLALLWARYGYSLREYVFATVYTEMIVAEIMVKCEPYKRRLFADLAELESRDPRLRKEGSVRILELGCGPGTNFAFYPDKCRVVCCEPNTTFAASLYAHRDRFPHVALEKWVVTGGEDLSAVEDGTVDAVVSTFVNCSVDDPKRVLSEVRRVLAPGGRYYFMDHVVQPKGSIRYWAGKLMMKPFFLFFFMCDMQSDILPIVQQAGFSTLDFTEFDPQQNLFIMSWIIHEFIMGCATK